MNFKFKTVSSILFFTIFIMSTAEAKTAREIAEESSEQNNLGLNDASTDLSMVIINKRGKKKLRKIKVWSKDIEKNNNTLVKFLAPADVKGVGFLSKQKSEDDTDQFLYLPALKKSKRILGSQKSQSFMGTDFSYGDLRKRNIDDFDHKKYADENFMGKSVYVVESIVKPAKSADSEYERIKFWIDKSNMVALKIDFYKKGKLLKTLISHKVESDNNRWVVKQSSMTNHKRKTKTLLRIDKINWEEKLPKTLFSKQSLER